MMALIEIRPEMRRSTAVELSPIKSNLGLVNLMNALRVLASLDTEMPIQIAAILVVVAQRLGAYQRDMGGPVGVSASSVSRNVHSLSRYRRDGTPGFGLVEQRLDAKDVRSQPLFLTVAGVDFVSRLLDSSAAVTRPDALPITGDAFAGRHGEVWVDYW